MVMGIPDPEAPVEVFVGVSEGTGHAMLVQRLEGEKRTVALVGRSLSNYELGRPPLEQKLAVARWALHRCRRFT